jgi:hypothetical protein
VTVETIMLDLHRAGWTMTERVTSLGHVAEAERSGHRITVKARSSEVAWSVLWAKLTGPRRFVVSPRRVRG